MNAIPGLVWYLGTVSTNLLMWLLWVVFSPVWADQYSVEYWRVPWVYPELSYCTIISSLVPSSLKSHLLGSLWLPKPSPQLRERANFCLGFPSLCYYLETLQVEIWNNCGTNFICISSFRIALLCCSLSWEPLFLMFCWLFQLFYMGR